MKVALGADHAGFQLKETLKKMLEEMGIASKDFGCASTAQVDYPDFAEAVARAVAGGEAERGIMVCGTGIGASIAANKIPGVRAALCHDAFTAVASRCHNDANVLCLGARVLEESLACEIARTWLKTDFSGEERHRRRISKIAQIEAKRG